MPEMTVFDQFQPDSPPDGGGTTGPYPTSARDTMFPGYGTTQPTSQVPSPPPVNYPPGTIFNPAYYKQTGQQMPQSPYPGGGQFGTGGQGSPQDPMQAILMQLLQTLLGGGGNQQQQQTQQMPNGNAIGQIQAMGGVVPNFLSTMGQNRPVSAPGDVSSTFQNFTGFGLPSPQTMGNMSPSEQGYFQGLTNSPLVGIPWGDLISAILSPYYGARTAPQSRMQ